MATGGFAFLALMTRLELSQLAGSEIRHYDVQIANL